MTDRTHTCIRHGDLVIDFNADGSVQLARKSNMTAIVLSITEWVFILKLCEIHDWPVAAPANIHPETTDTL
jgi:hypothetical protein